MANRRMFSLAVVDTDKFLDMPISAQCLYFHLGMHADDDGFVSSPKKIIKSTGCNNDDLRILVSKEYIIPFDSGVVVITDWKQNNYIQKDRYTPTIYTKYRRNLEEFNGKYVFQNTRIPFVSNLDTGYQDDEVVKITENNQNTNVSTQCIHNGYNMYTQDRIGKVRIDKVSIEEGDTHEGKAPSYPRPSDSHSVDICQRIMELYNTICISFPRMTKLSEARKKAIKARAKQYTIEDIEKVFRMAESSPFLKGGNDRNWTANFDWMIKDSNMAKILDGNYTDKKPALKTGNTFNHYPQRCYSQSEVGTLERLLLQEGGDAGWKGQN